MNTIKQHIKSYRYAMRGIWLAFRYERNMVFHLAAALGVIVLNILLSVTQTEWLITHMLIGVAWAAEVFNTAIDKLADRVTREQDPVIVQVKDLAGGAVLIIGLFAAVCGVVIYMTYLVGF